ncbi:MAG: 50S ribosomal protein L29 [Bdellovibrionales bacterium RBG_16_40_8]|nr:MAG: 50S ribosomal protein L29 [Bdellovibrionales bacterium RBG_16_40_8]
MKFIDIRDLTVEELRKREKSIIEESFDLRMKHSLGQVGNPLQIRSLRRDRARIRTALAAKLAR